MAYLVTKTGWQRKPPFGSVLDRSHQLARGMVGCWLANEGAGDRLLDIAGGYHGTSSSHIAWTGVVAGRDGPRVSNTSTQPYVDCGDIAALDGLTRLSIAGWWLQDAINANSALVAKWIYSTQGGFAIQSGQDSAPQVTIYLATSLTDDGGGCKVNASTNRAANRWHHLAFVYDGSQSTNATRLRVYQDGAEVSTTQSLGSVPTSLQSNSATLRWLYWDGLTRYWNGGFGGGQIWDRALSAAEVAWLYAEPYAMIRPSPAKRLYYAPASAPATRRPAATLLGVG